MKFYVRFRQHLEIPLRPLRDAANLDNAVVHEVAAVVVHLLPLPRVDTVGPGLVNLGVDREETAGIAGDAVPLSPHLVLLAGTTEIFRLI